MRHPVRFACLLIHLATSAWADGVPSFVVDYGPDPLRPDEVEYIDRNMRLVLEWMTQVDAPNLSVPGLVYVDLPGAPHDWQHEWLDLIQGTESAFLHTTDPASAVVFPEAGQTELRWRPDARLAAEDPGRYRVLRSDGGDAFLLRGITGSPAWTDQGTVASVDYVYRIETLRPDDTAMEYSGPLAYTPSADPGPAFWSGGWKLEPAGGDSARLLVVLDASRDAAGYTAELLIDLDRDNVWDEPGERVPARKRPRHPGFVVTLQVPRYRQGGIPYRFRITDPEQIVRDVPERGAFITSPNNRVGSDDFAHYYTDPGHPEVRAMLVAKARSRLELGSDGIFGDNANLRLKAWAVDAFPMDYDAARYENDMMELLGVVAEAIGPAPLIVNGLLGPESLPILGPTHGAMCEGFAYVAGSGVKTGAAWVRDLTTVLRAEQEHVGKRVLVLSVVPDADPEARLYALASFLLALGDDALFANSDRLNRGLVTFAEQHLDLGAPMETLAPFVPGESVTAPVTRAFERGWILVNPLPETTVTVSAPGVHRVRVDPHSFQDGGAVWTEPVSGVNLPPGSAAILLPAALPRP